MGTVCVDTQKRVTHLKKYARAVNEWRGLSGSQRPEKIYRRLRRAQSGAHYGLKIERVTCMPEMTVTVSMTAEEFQEFMEWRRDRNNYTVTMAEWNRQWEKMAEKAGKALAEDTERPGTMKIIDQESAEELLKMAREYLA